MKKYLDISEVTSLQIEPTSKCNLLCPQCARVYQGQVNPLLRLAELEPEDYESIFAEDLGKQLKLVSFNGNYGDPIASKHIDYGIDKCLDLQIQIRICSNGSLRPSSWWRELGGKLSGTKSGAAFSIDGLEDTNAIYRVGSNFKKIMENAAAYIQAGGRARWDFLVFDHNRHQIEEAKALARKMGFVQFQKKITSRFAYGHYSKPKEDLSYKIFNKKGEQTGFLKKTPDGEDRLQKIAAKYGSWKKYVESTSINCKFQNKKMLFIDFEALVWPCCWVGAPVYFVDQSNPQKKQFDLIRRKYGKGFNSLRRRSLKEILSHQWLASDLTESWGNNLSDQNPKLMTCGRTCGADYEFTSGPGGKNSEITDFAAPGRSAQTAAGK